MPWHSQYLLNMLQAVVKIIYSAAILLYKYYKTNVHTTLDLLQTHSKEKIFQLDKHTRYLNQSLTKRS